MIVRDFVFCLFLAKLSESGCFRQRRPYSRRNFCVRFRHSTLVGISSKVSVSLLDVVRVRVIVRVSRHQDVHTKELVETKKSGCTYRGTQ